MIKKLCLYVSISLIFICPIVDRSFELSLIGCFFILITSIFINNGIQLNGTVLLTIFVLCVHATINIFISNDDIILFFKQIFGIFTNYLMYLSVLKDEDNKYVLKIYVKMAVVVALIGIIQEFAYIINFRPLYDFSWLVLGQRVGVTNLGLMRVTSIMIEPAQLGMVLTPAVYLALSSKYIKKYIKINQLESVILILCYILTFSSVAYIGLFLILIFNITNFKLGIKKIIIGLVLIISIFTIYSVVDDFRLRVNDTISALNGENIENKNLSTYALISNLRVAIESNKNTLGLGSGIGSHKINYNKYIHNVVNTSKVQMQLNVDDANSLIIRLLSELGIVGVLFFFLFIGSNYIKRGENIESYICRAILTLIILRLIRQGHYFNDGFLFFIVIYIKNHRSVYKDIKLRSIDYVKENI